MKNLKNGIIIVIVSLFILTTNCWGDLTTLDCDEGNVLTWEYDPPTSFVFDKETYYGIKEITEDEDYIIIEMELVNPPDSE